MANPKIDEMENKWWYNDKGELHLISKNSNQTFWFRLGSHHRMDGPAIEYANGYKQWYIDGKRHRTDGPAIEYADGCKMWFINGKRHRTDGSPSEYANGDKAWYIDGKRHRIDGPAIIRNGNKVFFINGQKITDAEEINRIDNYHEDRLAFAHSAMPVYSFGHTFFRKRPLLNIIKSYSMTI